MCFEEDVQKVNAVNALGERVELRHCSCSSKSAVEIDDKLGVKYAPFMKMIICRSLHHPGW